MNLKYDWDWMREYYVRSCKNRTSLKDISELFNVPYQTVRRVAAKENLVGNVAVGRCANLIDYFESFEDQDSYLNLGKTLAHRNYDILDEMRRFDGWF